MTFKNLISKIITMIGNKIEAMNQKEIDRQHQIAEQKRKEFETAKGTYLRKRWALALNALPAHMQVSSQNIDSYALSNKLLQPTWELQISLAESISISKCNYLMNQLQEILTNQYLECCQEFQQKLSSDANEYSEQLLLDTTNARTKEDSAFLLGYKQFYSANYHRLIDIDIISIVCDETTLNIQYQINETDCLYFYPNTYWLLVCQFLDC